MLDVNYTEIEDLEVYGTLLFDDRLNNTILKVRSLKILGGRVVAGDITHPFSSRLTIEFWSNYWSSSDLDNRGRLELYGAERPVRWTRLRQTSAVGSNWLYPDNFAALDWNAGDEVVVASSTHDQFEAERFTIAARDEQNKRLLISPAIVRYKHFGAAFAETHSSKTLDVRAEIGLLSNSIEIKSAEVMTTSSFGSAVLKNVHLKSCSFNFVGPSTAISSSLSGVTISNARTVGLRIYGATSMSISDMVIYNTWGSSITIEASSNIALTVRIPTLMSRALFSRLSIKT